ncbi:MAG: lipoprotein [Acidiferrobacterales bacterium]
MTRIALPLLVVGVLATAAGALMGCGKKGSLYLPEPVKQEQTDDSREEEQSKKQSNKQY